MAYSDKVWQQLTNPLTLVAIVIMLFASALALVIALLVNNSAQIAEINYRYGRLDGTLETAERFEAEFEAEVESCSVEIARIEGYLEAMKLLAGLESGQQWTEVLNEFRQQRTNTEEELFEFP